MAPKRPQVVAHRGSSSDNAEHTLAAYRAALDEGADALECDVRLTADGHLVCVHDRDLRRTATREGLVSNMSLAQLEDLDFASWKNPWTDLDEEAPERDPDLGKVLTMQSLLQLAADYPRRVGLAIETKHPTRYSGLVERRLVELLDDFGWTGRDSPARVMSFSIGAVKRVERLAPRLDTVLLVDKRNHWKRMLPMIEDHWIAGPGIGVLRKRPEFVRKLARRRPVHVWTVNTVADADLCLELGVSALITDRPALIKEHLDRLDL